MSSNLDFLIMQKQVILKLLFENSVAQWTVQAPTCLQAHHTSQECLKSGSIHITSGTALRFDLSCVAIHRI